MKRFFATTTAALLFAMGAAQAHTHLESSMPADNAVLSAAPSELMLHFSEPTRLTSVSIQKEGSDEQQVISALPKGPSAAVKLPLAPLEAGKYVVNWRAIGGDNHVMTGKLHFTVGSK
jgi:methionine-rich copper-binding protein CopC